MQPATKILNCSLLIKNINLAVRFPCSVCFSLRSDNNIVEGRTQHQLINGTAKMQERISGQIQVSYNNQHYEDKKISLMITMVSSNGKITAGSVDLEITKNGNICENHTQKQYSINKCPDRLAKVVIHKNIEYVRDGQKLRQASKSHRTNSLLNVYTSKGKQPNQSYHEGPPINRYHTLRSPVARLNTMNDEKTQQKYYFRHKRQQPENNRKKYESLLMHQAEDNTSQLQQQLRINLQSNSDQSQPPIAQDYKTSLKLTQRKKSIHPTYNHSPYTHQHSKQSQQHYKQKYKNSQHKLLQLQNQLNSLNDLCNKYKEKNNQYEKIITEKEKQIQRQVKLLKELEGQIAYGREKIQGLELELGAAEKRIEFKEGNYKEQLVKLNEKYRKSETERLAAVYTLNEKIKQIEEIQKNSQNNLREREKQWIQERNKYYKNNCSIDSQLKELQQKYCQLESQLHQKTHLLHTQTQHHNQLTQKLEQLSETLTQKSTEITQLHQKLESSSRLAASVKNYEEQQKLYKNRIQQMQLELSEKEQMWRNVSKSYQHLVVEGRNWERKVGEMKSEYNQMLLRVGSLERENQGFRRQIRQLTTQNKQSHSHILTLKTQLQNTKSNLELTSSHHTLQISKYQQQLSLIKKQKQKILHIAKNNKNSASGIQDRCHALQQQLQQTKKQLLFLNQQIFTYRSQSNRLSAQNQDLHQLLNNQKQYHTQLQTKQHSHTKELTHRNQTIYLLTKTLKELEQTIQQLENQSKRKEQLWVQKQKSLEGKIGELEGKLEKEGEKINEGEYGMRMLEQEVVMGRNQRGRLEENLRGYEEREGRYKEEYMYLEDKFKDITNKYKQVLQRNMGIQKQLRQLEKDHERTKEILRSKQQHESTLTQQVKQGIQKLCDHLTKPTQHKPNQHYFNQQTIDHPLNQALTTNSTHLSTLTHKLTYLQQTNQYLQQQLHINKQHYQQQITLLTAQLNTHKEANKRDHDKLLQERETLVEEVNRLEESLFLGNLEKQRLVGENGRLKGENGSLEREVERLERERGVLVAEKQELNRCVSRIENSPHLNQSQNYLGPESKVSSNSSDSPIRRSNRQRPSPLNQQKLHCLQHQLQQKSNLLSQQHQKTRQLTTKTEHLQSRLTELQTHLSQLQQTNKSLQATNNQLSLELQIQQNSHTQLLKKNRQYQLNNSKLMEQIESLVMGNQRLLGDIKEMEGNLRRGEGRWQAERVEGMEVLGEMERELGECRQEIIRVKGELELKEYVIQQKDKQLQDNKIAIQQMQQTILTKKHQIQTLKQTSQTLSSTLLQKQSAISSLQTDNHKYHQQTRTLKSKNQSLKQQLSECQLLQEIIRTKQREIKRTKQEYEQLQEKYQALEKNSRNQLVGLKHENLENVEKMEELRRKCRDQEQVIQRANYSMKLSKHKYRSSCEREVQEVLGELEREQFQKNCIKVEFQNYRKATQKEMESLKKSIKPTTFTRTREDASDHKKFRRNTLMNEGTNETAKFHIPRNQTTKLVQSTFQRRNNN